VAKGDARTAPSVLVADDDAGLRAIVRVALATQGWTVLEARTPEDTMEMARRLRPQIILLDVVFEGHARDGFSICRELKSLDATRKIPVIIFTAHDDAENRAFASAVGATAYLAKPFGALDLVGMLRLVHESGGSEPALGLYLIDAGVIRPAQLERALAEQRLQQGKKTQIGQILIELGFAGQEDVRRALARQRRSRDAQSAPRPARDLRVVIADDHASVREGLRATLSADEGFDLVGIAPDGEEALRLVRETHPDLVVLDSDMPKRTGLEVLRAIDAEMPEVEVVMFTLDDRIRDAALRAGAAAVVTKDLPLRVLVAELRHTGTVRMAEVPTSGGVLVAARNVSRVAWGAVARRKRAFAVMGVLLVAYAGAFLVAEPVLGASAAVIALVPVALAGALLGIEGGLAAAILVGVASALLWEGTDHTPGEAVLTIGGNYLGFLAMMGLGAGFGAMRVLRGRVDRRSRRAGALADAALTLASGLRPETLELFAQAALEVVPGDAALVYSTVPGGGLEIVAVAGAPRTLVGRRESAGAVAEAQASGRASLVRDLAAASIGIRVPRMRSAVVVPAAIPGQRAGGVIAVFSTRRDTLTDVHVATLETYGAFVGMAIGTSLDTSRAAAQPVQATATEAAGGQFNSGSSP